MKSSLKFTAIALLLGGVLHVQSLDAASGYSLEDINQQLRQPTGHFSGSTEGPKLFVAYIGGLVESGITQETLEQELTASILASSVPVSFFKEAREEAKGNLKGLAVL